MLSLLLPLFIGAHTLNYNRCPSIESCELKNGVLQMRLLPGEERAEVRDSRYIAFGEAIAVRLYIYIPETTRLETDNQSIVLAQFKAQNGESPPVALRLKAQNQYAVTIRYNGAETVLYRGAIARGRWVKFHLHLKTGLDGRVRIRQDRELVVDFRGGVGYEGTANYFKFGPYDYTRTQKSVFQIHYSRYRLSPISL